MAELLGREACGRSGPLHGGVKQLEQAEMPHITDEHPAARMHQLHRALQDSQEILRIGEILHD